MELLAWDLSLAASHHFHLPPHGPLRPVTADCTVQILMRRVVLSLNTEDAIPKIINILYYTMTIDNEVWKDLVSDINDVQILQQNQGSILVCGTQKLREIKKNLSCDLSEANWMLIWFCPAQIIDSLMVNHLF